jgi:hypothetical protein
MPSTAFCAVRHCCRPPEAATDMLQAASTGAEQGRPLHGTAARCLVNAARHCFRPPEAARGSRSGPHFKDKLPIPATHCCQSSALIAAGGSCMLQCRITSTTQPQLQWMALLRVFWGTASIRAMRQAPRAAVGSNYILQLANAGTAQPRLDPRQSCTPYRLGCCCKLQRVSAPCTRPSRKPSSQQPPADTTGPAGPLPVRDPREGTAFWSAEEQTHPRPAFNSCQGARGQPHHQRAWFLG